MAGKIDKSHTHFLRAVDGDEWELWSFSEKQKSALYPSSFRPCRCTGRDGRCSAGRTHFTFPAWLATSDRTVIPEILHLQLEKRGLLSKNSGDSAVDYRVIDTRETRH